jgi:hypothetical protein
MAIRAYYPCDLEDLARPPEAPLSQGPPQPRRGKGSKDDAGVAPAKVGAKNSKIEKRNGEGDKGADDDDDFDNLQRFLRSFQLALVLFILPDVDIMMQQLDDTTSFFHRAQRVVRALSIQQNNAGSVSPIQRGDLAPAVLE